MTPIVEVRNLWKKFPGTIALQDFNLILEKGKVLGLIGPNGSGKTTLLSILAGLKSPTSGTVRVFGRTPGSKTRQFTAYVPEIDHLYRWMEVGEIIDFFSKFYPDWDNDKCKNLIEFFDLDPKRKISTLSRGFRSRLKLLLALSSESKLLLLDEPLSGIDPISRSKVLEAFLKWFRFGEQTVIFSTHIVREAEKLFDYVIFLDRGRVALEGEPDELRARFGKSIEEIMLEVLS